MTKSTACPSCGAKLTADSERCDLCGSEVSGLFDPATGGDQNVFTEEAVAAVPVASVPMPSSVEPVSCGTCRHVNPARSRFCNQCGTFLSDTRPVPEAARWKQDEPDVASIPTGVFSETKVGRPSSDVGKRALWMVGLGVLAVIVLYAVTVMSDRNQAPSETQQAQAPVGSTSGSTALPDSLAEIVSALEAEGTAASWAQVGGVYFNAAMRADEAAKAEFSSRAVDAFDLSLAIEENADIRTSLAEAAQFDPRNPMRAVIELQAVLASTPDHVAANYLLGALRARIGRLEDAAQSFQRVIDLTSAEDPIHQRAAADLAAVRQSLDASP